MDYEASINLLWPQARFNRMRMCMTAQTGIFFKQMHLMLPA